MKVYSILSLLLSLAIAADELPNSFQDEERTSIIDPDVPDSTLSPQFLDVITAYMVEFPGARLEENSTGLLEALQENNEVRDSLSGRLTECWWATSAMEDLDEFKTVECAVEGHVEIARIIVRVVVSERRLQSALCPDGQYMDATLGCLPCDVSCGTCKGPKLCLTCAPDYYTPDFVAPARCYCMVSCLVASAANIPCVNCVKGYTWDRTSCRCVCVQTVLCRLGYEWDKASCKCRCIQTQRCPAGYAWDYYCCKCKCLPKICPRGYYWDSENCKCKCTPALCPANLTWNSDCCKCQCIQQKCAPGYVWDSVNCRCFCPVVDCSGGRDLDTVTCQCFCPMLYCFIGSWNPLTCRCEIPCKSGYVAKGIDCVPCDVSCLACVNDPVTCITCAVGYHWSTPGVTSGACVAD